MLFKAQNKYIRSLGQQKFRSEHKAYIAEGDKICREWLASPARIQMIVVTSTWAEENNLLIQAHPEAELFVVKDSELAAVSAQQTPSGVLLVVHQPDRTGALPTNEWCLALDDLQDPGNMGTIIRTADWFGIGHIICSPGCVDVYNPKVVQSAMGGHLRVRLYEASLASYLSSLTIPRLAATLNGERIYKVAPIDRAAIIIGNESKGISQAVLEAATQQITIPRRGGAESLNAGVSAGILCALLIGG